MYFLVVSLVWIHTGITALLYGGALHFFSPLWLSVPGRDLNLGPSLQQAGALTIELCHTPNVRKLTCLIATASAGTVTATDFLISKMVLRWESIFSAVKVKKYWRKYVCWSILLANKFYIFLWMNFVFPLGCLSAWTINLTFFTADPKVIRDGISSKSSKSPQCP